MPLGKYYCDYCDKQFQDTSFARKRHLEGAQHQRAKALWYASFRSGGLDAAGAGAVGGALPPRGVCHHFVRTGFCQFGDGCRYFHPKPIAPNEHQVVPAGSVGWEDESSDARGSEALSPRDVHFIWAFAGRKNLKPTCWDSWESIPAWLVFDCAGIILQFGSHGLNEYEFMVELVGFPKKLRICAAVRDALANHECDSSCSSVYNSPIDRPRMAKGCFLLDKQGTDSAVMACSSSMGSQRFVGSSVLVNDRAGISWGNLPPSLRPPPEGGYPPLPFVDWG